MVSAPEILKNTLVIGYGEVFAVTKEPECGLRTNRRMAGDEPTWRRILIRNCYHEIRASKNNHKII